MGGYPYIGGTEDVDEHMFRRVNLELDCKDDLLLFNLGHPVLLRRRAMNSNYTMPAQVVPPNIKLIPAAPFLIDLKMKIYNISYLGGEITTIVTCQEVVIDKWISNFRLLSYHINSSVVALQSSGPPHHELRPQARCHPVLHRPILHHLSAPLGSQNSRSLQVFLWDPNITFVGFRMDLIH